jgi:hypothetical protein
VDPKITAAAFDVHVSMIKLPWCIKFSKMARKKVAIAIR